MPYNLCPMILIALGSNLPSDKFGSPLQTVRAAIAELARRDVRIIAGSKFYQTAPVPASDQPWYVNAVIVGETGLDAAALLKLLHGVESDFGRTRGIRNEARILDLDLLAYGNETQTGDMDLPHPRLHDRLFVLRPLCDIVPDWVHPSLHKNARQLLAECTDKSEISAIKE